MYQYDVRPLYIVRVWVTQNCKHRPNIISFNIAPLIPNANQHLKYIIWNQRLRRFILFSLEYDHKVIKSFWEALQIPRLADKGTNVINYYQYNIYILLLLIFCDFQQSPTSGCHHYLLKTETLHMGVALVIFWLIFNFSLTGFLYLL